jgi:RHH-type rel operon transcriptional repressor/antitoxin RelB
MLAIRLDPEIENRLSILAERTGRTKTFYAREAILEHLEDLEDFYMAKKVLSEGGRTYSLQEIKDELGV